VIGLQTASGGGKTHTMLALYHLARFARDGGDPRALAGMADVLDKAGVTTLPKSKTAVFVGSGAGPDVSLKLDKGPRVYTVWGYLAWRLAGDAGTQLMAEAERARTSPGSALLVELFKLAGPSRILLDELTMFARQLDDERFEAFLSFIQSLTEAAKMVPGVLIVGSLPESNAEAGGDRGIEALRRMEQVFGRVQSPWLPDSGDETYEIIRRRLFRPLDSEGEKARDETVKAFVDMYRSYSTGCRRIGRPSISSSARAAYCDFSPISSACSGTRKRAIRSLRLRVYGSRMSACGQVCSIRSIQLSARSLIGKSMAKGRCREHWS
jgi:predicted AAA+ superfamily ATPase